MSEVMEPTAQEWSGPKTIEEVQVYLQGFIGGATAYARVRGDSTLKTGNNILGKLIEEQGWRTVEAMESIMAATDEDCSGDLMVIVNQYREADAKARKAVEKAFPIGSKVKILMAQGSIIGEVDSYPIGVSDRVSCLLESGNIWSYSVSRLSRV